MQLGARYYSAIAPVVKLVEKAQTEGTDLSKADLLKTVGMKDSDDVCGRGNVLISKGGLMTNTGRSSICAFSSTDLPRAQIAALGIKASRANPTRMYGALRERVEMNTGPALMALSADHVVAQTTADATSPFIVFDGAGGQKLTLNYGGPIHEISRIAVTGRPPQTVISTANGCIAVAEK